MAVPCLHLLRLATCFFLGAHRLHGTKTSGKPKGLALLRNQFHLNPLFGVTLQLEVPLRAF